MRIVADPAAKRAAKIEKARAARRRAFQVETDPLIGKVLRGEISADDYAAHVAQVRARFPYPEEDQQ
ncbi:hypothetical protein [Roseicitreum antarcticum]|uniref:Antitoxin VbhA domain-containing protein n=1 Tax=Roseicitreum antarcticum TaxID=564137 RepID=A0A1H2WD04_9RHOB|nr:hypothetical protein [Roseicitreum antarcticum]SDW78573.1 hypothetical protein SAMN04488238_103346 [Roseicitreum antarcticum]